VIGRPDLRLLDEINDVAEAASSILSWEIRKATARLQVLACEAQIQSKDPRTKVAAAIVRPDFSIVSTGYNGMPRGIPDTPENWDPSVKYDLVRHAEENAFDHTHGSSTDGCYLVCNLFPCHRCAGQIAQRGIRKVFYSASIRQDLKPELALRIFEARGIECIRIPGIVHLNALPEFIPAVWDDEV
jgi:dCMP deaminase